MKIFRFAKRNYQACRETRRVLQLSKTLRVLVVTAKRRQGTAVGALIVLLILVTTLAGPNRSQAQPPHNLGYGFNVAQLDLELVESIGFNWVKLFDRPTNRLPVHVLLRIDADATHMADLEAFGHDMHHLAYNHGAYIEAYEIGNEVNLDADYGWTAPPNAADYATLLCVAYAAIKQADPGGTVVSAGLAPTGRVSGNWNGHPGHNGFYQDEREFLKEFLTAGGGSCLDAVGYHPYGFSADFDTPPDTNGGQPATYCVNGFCFRGTEKIYEIMEERGLGHKRIWATELGWITEPPDHCLAHPGWQGREWQIVTEEKQASNLVGAFQYAEAHWPWMGAMFIFNLNFNTAFWYEECEQMRFYGIDGRPAEAALREMPKNVAPGRLLLSTHSVTWLLGVDEQPLTLDVPFWIINGGGRSFVYTVTADDDAAVVPVLADTTGELAPDAQAQVGVTLASDGRETGVYTGTLTVTASPLELSLPDIEDTPQMVSITLHVVPEIYRVYLPAVLRP